MSNKKIPWHYRFVKSIVKAVSPKYVSSGTENLPKEPCMVISNHCQVYGPVALQFYFERPTAVWCTYEMTELKEVPAYAYKDFWWAKPKWIKWLYKILSYIIAPLAVYVFKYADIVPVYKDIRLIKTIKGSIEKLEEGENIHIFPEKIERHNNVVNEFQDKFVDIAKMYYVKTKQKLSFVPMYLCPKLKTIVYGKPVEFNPDNKLEFERERICNYLMDEITELAKSLPEHRVIPYINMKKKDYPKNTD